MTEKISSFVGNRWLILVFAMSLSFFVIYAQNAFADTVTSTIPIGANPRGIGVNQDTNKIYVITQNNVSVIDGSTDTFLTDIPLGAALVDVDVNPNTNMIYALGTKSGDVKTVFAINGSTNQIVATIDMYEQSSYAEDVKVNPNTNKIYVSISRGYCLGGCHWSKIQVINGTTNTVVKTILSNPGQLSQIEINPTTNKLYIVDHYNGTILMVDGATDTSTGKMIGDVPCCMAINTSTNTLYTSERNSTGSTEYDSVGVIDLSTNAHLTQIPTGSPTGSKNVNPNTNKIYVSHPNYGNGNTISVIDGSTNTIIRTLTVGIGPISVGINPNTNKIYVVNQGSNTISVIDDSSPPSAKSALIINSQDNIGNMITGFYTELYQNENEVATDYTPASFTLNNNERYAVHVEDYGDYVFDHWLDTGSTDASRDISISSNTQITAVYKTIPQPPEGLTATGKILKIDLRWNTPTDDGGSPITGYKIERSTNNGNIWSTLVANTGNDTITYSDTKVLPLTSYMYRVSAINDVGTSIHSNTASAITPSSGPIIVPRIL